MKQPRAALSGLILAGGKSSRMGVDKATIRLGGDTLLGHVVRRLSPQLADLALNAPHTFPAASGLRLVPDRQPGQIGPLEGVLSGLRDLQDSRNDAPYLLTVPCDSPFLPDDLADRLHDKTSSDTVVIAASGGCLHPVFGLWPTAIADDLEIWLTNPENRRIKAFLDRHRVVVVDFPFVAIGQGMLDPFMNINTQEELAMAETFAGTL